AKYPWCRYHSVVIQKLTFQNNNQLYIKNTSKSKYQLNFYLFNKKIQIDLHQLTHTKTLKIKALNKN
ncbi:hypothetical protein DO532_16900, partial [Salmonella enterica subsp. enterica serovar Kentucky]|nr:hypothetical protein [Salmonella enterica subsp. enterica serovar Kentucky]ECA3527146.1 hypothetical protein [Salmonella enterica subsp. enterica serovar Kentucky]ECT0063409.1 hypothetical protein [Salmonella enterica subsp. enterica serovar Kentucky]